MPVLKQQKQGTVVVKKRGMFERKRAERRQKTEAYMPVHGPATRSDMIGRSVMEGLLNILKFKHTLLSIK